MDEKKNELENLEQDGTEADLVHMNEGYIVRVHFGREEYTATDALKHYLQQIAQLKY